MNASDEYGDRRNSTPETKAGENGLAHDGQSIPAAEMVDSKRGAAPEALERFAQAAVTDREELLRQLASSWRPTHIHRPLELTRGDIQRKDWDRFLGLQANIRRILKKRKRLPDLVYCLYYLIGEIDKHGSVRTSDALFEIEAARGCSDAVAKACDDAVSLIWSMAGIHEFEVDSAVVNDVQTHLNDDKPDSPTP